MSERIIPEIQPLFAIILIILSGTITSATTINVDSGPDGNNIIAPGESWKYFKGTEPPSNPYKAWTAIDFDDSNWQTGPGGFGYGDGDDTTVLDDMRGNYVSVYIRKEFSASSLSPDDIITLEIDYDDGFIAYLNGKEIARANTPAGGAAAYNTTASSAHEAGSPETFVLGTAGELLNGGGNILTIEGHNVSSSSSDFSLIAALGTAADVTKIGETWIVETDTVTLKGDEIAAGAVSVLVDGIEADFDANTGNWSVEIPLVPGINSITIEQLDANTNVVDTRTVEIRYVAEVKNAAGELIENTTWSGVCVVEDTVTVPAGVVLKIEPATVVMMKDAAGLIVYGQLLAEGTETNPIHFTRYGDGVTWKQIMFVEAEDSRLAHCIIEYTDSEGAHQDYYEPGPRDYHEAVVALASHVDIENCIFRNLPDESGAAEGDAIAVISDDQDHPGYASANIQGCEFRSIGQGVHTRYSYVLVEECYFTGKRGDNDDVDLWGESTPAPLIRNNLFLNPEHDDMINPTQCSAVIIGNVIAGCDDHGIVLRDKGFPVLMNNLIIDCRNAGVAVENSCRATLINNTIVDCGRGLRLFDLGRWGPPYNLNPGGGTATVINCIIWNCPQPVTLADSSNTEIEDRGSHITVKYSDIEGGEDGISVSGSQSTVTWGQGNINTDPKFAAAGTGDYHLKSEAGRWDESGENWVLDNITSPCIDAGDPNSPVAFEPYPNGAIINMGAYGGKDEAGKSPSGLHSKYGGGTGEPNEPYLIYTAGHLNALGSEPNDYDKHFKLMADVDLSGYLYEKAVIAPHIGNQDLFKGIPFTGVFDGNGHTISHLTIDGRSMVSLFGLLESGAEVRNIGIQDVNITASGTEVGGLVSKNQGYVANCYSTGTVSGDWSVGGLVGNNLGSITNCYSNSTVIGNSVVGGLVGINNGIVIHCHSNNTVDGGWLVGGLVGSGREVDVAFCFWNIETSGQTTSAGGTGKTTTEMQNAGTFLEAGWDFMEETENGTEDIWWINEGQDYPMLWWELID